VSFEQFTSFFAVVVPEWKASRINRLRLPSGRTPADLGRWRRSIEATTYPLYRAADVADSPYDGPVRVNTTSPSQTFET